MTGQGQASPRRPVGATRRTIARSPQARGDNWLAGCSPAVAKLAADHRTLRRFQPTPGSVAAKLAATYARTLRLLNGSPTRRPARQAIRQAIRARVGRIRPGNRRIAGGERPRQIAGPSTSPKTSTQHHQHLDQAGSRVQRLQRLAEDRAGSGIVGSHGVPRCR